MEFLRIFPGDWQAMMKLRFPTVKRKDPYRRPLTPLNCTEQDERNTQDPLFSAHSDRMLLLLLMLLQVGLDLNCEGSAERLNSGQLLQ